MERGVPKKPTMAEVLASPARMEPRTTSVLMLYQPFGIDDNDTASSTDTTERLSNRAYASANLPIFLAGLPDLNGTTRCAGRP